MEEKDTMKKEEVPKDNELSPKKKEEEKPKELNSQNINGQDQKENSQSNELKNDEDENKPQERIDLGKKSDSKINSQNNNNNNNTEKGKRHRRGKNEISERNYRCPDCNKCYLSGPALTTHRKTKHGYGNDGEKRNRGRPPRKDGQNDNGQTNPLNKFNYFFLDDKRRPSSLDEDLNNKTINIDVIKEFMGKIFNQCKKELFQKIVNVEEYSFYKLFVENWNKENDLPIKECLSAISKQNEPSLKVNSYNLDELFFSYLKEFSGKTNKDYFWFMMKFIVLFRECINTLRESNVKQEDQSENNKLYTQIYNAETVPEICNDFFVEFMEPYQFFGLNKEELIELIQHFCYWLYSKQYTQSHLTLLDG
jgi:hypothetical protein